MFLQSIVFGNKDHVSYLAQEGTVYNQSKKQVEVGGYYCI